MTEAKLLKASERYDLEWSRWKVRRNKANQPEARWEIVKCVRGGDPVVKASSPDQTESEIERDRLRGISAMRCALKNG